MPKRSVQERHERLVTIILIVVAVGALCLVIADKYQEGIDNLEEMDKQFEKRRQIRDSLSNYEKTTM